MEAAIEVYNALTERLIFGIPVLQWLVFVIVTIVLFIVTEITLRFFRKKVENRAAKTDHRFDDYALRILKRTKNWAVLAFAGYVALYFVELRAAATRGDTVEGTLQILFKVALFIQLGLWGSSLLDEALRKALQLANFTEAATRTALGVAKFFGLLAIWSTVGLLVLNGMGIEITPLLAGLGVGGIAVAFALQQILGDIFCSVAIVIDRPFEVGDFIIVGDFMGVVEHIGIKTTRVRSLGGEQIIFPNSDLIASRVRNYKRMEERRVLFTVGVTYRTTTETLAQIPVMIKDVITAIDHTRFDRAHFQKFGDSSLDFEVVYYVLSPDYNLYMDIQQEINLGIFRRFGDMGVEIAFPSRSLYFEESPAPLKARVEMVGGNGPSSAAS